MKGIHRQRDDDECVLDPARRWRGKVREMLKTGYRSESQYATGSDHGENQPSLPAHVGLGEDDRYQGSEHHRRQQVRCDERNEKNGDPVTDTRQGDRLLISTATRQGQRDRQHETLRGAYRGDGQKPGGSQKTHVLPQRQQHAGTEVHGEVTSQEQLKTFHRKPMNEVVAQQRRRSHCRVQEDFRHPPVGHRFGCRRGA